MIQKILIADDEPDVLTMLSEIFSHYGYDVVTASDAEEFERVFFKTNPDLILLDIFFGEHSGPDVYDRVMKLAGAPQTPVIFLTGKLEGTTESPLVRGRQVALYLKPLSAHRIVTDIRLAFSSEPISKPA